MTRTLIILLIAHLTLFGVYKTRDSYTYWLPTRIVEIDKSNPEKQTTTVFGYDTQYRLITITKMTLFNNNVFTAFINYNDVGLISKIVETSTKPAIPTTEFQFRYSDNIVSQIKMINNDDTVTTRVLYNKEANSYSYQYYQTSQAYHFNEDNNLRTIQIDEIKMVEIFSHYNKGLFQEIIIQPALYLVHNQLYATNLMTMFMYNTQEVKRIVYDGYEMLIKNERDEYGNIVKANFYGYPKGLLELRVSYEMNEMRL